MIDILFFAEISWFYCIFDKSFGLNPLFSKKKEEKKTQNENIKVVVSKRITWFNEEAN